VLEGISFAWKTRLSKRAKRPRITISAYGNVELVWPISMSKRHVESMLLQYQPWVLKHLDSLQGKQKSSLALPERIDFKAIDEIWDVDYQQTDRSRISLSEKEGVLLVAGDIQNQEKVRKALCRWIKKQGQTHLAYWLADVAAAMGLKYQSLNIRLQKKRWGSCSAAKKINLNAALLFLPPVLVEHVLIHELSHLNHLNHSPSFWAEVAKYDKDYISHRKLLRQHAVDVPAWLTEAFVGV